MGAVQEESRSTAGVVAGNGLGHLGMPGMLSMFRTTGLLACLLLSGCGPSKANPEGVKQQLASKIPLHSSQTQVLDYLDSQKIAHSPYHHDQEKGNAIDATVFVKSTRDMVDPNYSVQFRFDDHDRLIEYDVQWLGYIPL